jgi:membrane protein DedA with SNARE-associated domain
MSARQKLALTVLALCALVAGGIVLRNAGFLLALLKDLTGWLVATIGKMGYGGIVTLMFLESSFFPFPSEVVLPPAGYLVWKGEMSFAAVALAGIAGSILGALFNYWFALRLGRPFLIRYGKYFFVSEESIAKADAFFQRHGHISTLVGRLLPVIRQYISLPAGIAQMRLSVFIAYTAIGAGFWVVILTLAGYLLGEHQEFLDRYLRVLTFGCVLCAAALILGYWGWFRYSASIKGRARKK